MNHIKSNNVSNLKKILRLVLLFILFISFEQCSKPRPLILSFSDKLENGDLIFRRGRSVESHAVLMADKDGEFSHVGIICKENSQIYVIHAVPGESKGKQDYIKKDKLEDFLQPERASRFAVYRSDFSKKIKMNAVNYALDCYKKKLIFDDKYDLSTDDKLYCTEFIYKAFKTAGNRSFTLKTSHISILVGNLGIILPSNIIGNSHFQQIQY